MDQLQRKAIEIVILLCEGDKDLLNQSVIYGRWFEQMLDHLADLDEGKLWKSQESSSFSTAEREA